MKKKVGVLVSGGGTNLQALIDFETKNADCPYEIVLVLSDHKDAYALERAKNAGIESRIVSPYAVMGAEVAKASDRDTKRLAVSNKILEYCKEFGVEIIVEAGCLTVLAGDVLTVYANKIINAYFRFQRNSFPNKGTVISFFSRKDKASASATAFCAA